MLRKIFGIVAAAVTLLVAYGQTTPANAFVVTFDENGTCIGCLAVTYGPDPTYTGTGLYMGSIAPGYYAGSVLVYQLPQPIGPGDVYIYDPGGHKVSDDLRFFENSAITKGYMAFYSFDLGGLLADLPAGLGPPPGGVAAPLEENDAGAFRFTDGPNIYNGVSGLLPTPLPATLPLLAGGIGLIVLVAGRRRRNAAAGP